MSVGHPEAHGWNLGNQVNWIDEVYPTDIDEILVEEPDTKRTLGSNVQFDNEHLKALPKRTYTMNSCMTMDKESAMN